MGVSQQLREIGLEACGICGSLLHTGFRVQHNRWHVAMSTVAEKAGIDLFKLLIHLEHGGREGLAD